MFRNILQVQLKLTKGRSKGASEVATARVRPSRRAAESLISESGRDAAGSATQSSALPLRASSPRHQGLSALIPVFAGHGAAGWYRSRAQLMVTRRLGFARARRLACWPGAAGAGPATRWTSRGGSGSESLNGDSDLNPHVCLAIFGSESLKGHSDRPAPGSRAVAAQVSGARQARLPPRRGPDCSVRC